MSGNRFSLTIAKEAPIRESRVENCYGVTDTAECVYIDEFESYNNT